MSALSTMTKARLGIKLGTAAAKRPGLLMGAARAGTPAAKLALRGSRPAAKGAFKLAKPMAKRRGSRGVDSVADTMRQLEGQLLGLARQAQVTVKPARPSKLARTAPRVAAGALFGAGAAAYLLDPDKGEEHRRTLARLIGS